MICNVDGSRLKGMSEHGSSTSLASITPTNVFMYRSSTDLASVMKMLEAGQKGHAFDEAPYVQDGTVH